MLQNSTRDEKSKYCELVYQGQIDGLEEEKVELEEQINQIENDHELEKQIMYNKIKNILPKENENNTFAINVNRKGEHKFTSTELARDLAGAVFDVYPDISVDLDNPKLIVHVKVLNNKCLIYTEQR